MTTGSFPVPLRSTISEAASEEDLLRDELSKESMSMLDEATGEQFKVGIRGEVIQPGEPDYAEARKAYNAMIDKHPRVIVRCADVADVISCVNFARENDVILAVRGGGHGVAGFSLVDDGLVIDLSQMRGVRVDPQGRMVRVEGGATFRETIAAANKEKGI